MKVMIHACKNRMNYVKGFLVPALEESGYDSNDIYVYKDESDGCLKAYLKSFDERVPKEDGYIWHLQDDVLPRLDFYNHAEVSLKNFMPKDIVCGFGNKEFYDIKDFGYAYNSKDKFYSFPCIRIPNNLAHDFVTWFETRARKDETLQKYIVHNKFVDYLFKVFLDNVYFKKNRPVFNYMPCLVDHVDEFVGGSTVNKQRPKPAKALIFEDDLAFDRLCKWYKKEKEKANG